MKLLLKRFHLNGNTTGFHRRMQSCNDKSSHHNLIYAHTFLAPNVFAYLRCGYKWSWLIPSTSIGVLHTKSKNAISSYTFFDIVNSMKPVLRRPHNKRAPCIERILESESPSPAWPALNRGRGRGNSGVQRIGSLPARRNSPSPSL